MFNDLLAIIAAPKAFGAPLYLLIPTVALGIVYIVLVIRFCMHMRGLKVTWNGTKKKMVLVLGPKNAGKTMLFHALREGRGVETVSSMKELEATFAIHPALNPSKFDAKLNIVDFPGHERLRSRVADFYPVTGCIVFMVDSADLVMLRKAAEFLYDIFSNAKLNDLSPPILIACNKSDLPKAASPNAIRDALEKELTQLKTTRSSLEAEGDEQDSTHVPVGRDGAAFEFAVDSPCEVSFTKCSVKKGSVEEVVTFMQKY